MAKRATRKPVAKAPSKAHIVLTGVDDSPQYYANHIEVAHSVHEFELVFARLPAKVSDEKMQELVTSGRLETDVLLRVVIPTSLMIDMIRVLGVQKDRYEATVGPLLEPGAGVTKDE